MAIPGVYGFVSAKDVPGSNMTGLVKDDEEIFASKHVRQEFILYYWSKRPHHSKYSGKRVAISVVFKWLQRKLLGLTKGNEGVFLTKQAIETHVIRPELVP